MPLPLLLDFSHTAHSRARTGIQRVARSLHSALGEAAVAITYDPHERSWRELGPAERANLTAPTPASKRGAQWPATAVWRGRLRRLLGARPKPLPAAAGSLCPEIFSPAVAANLAGLPRPRVALFHDAIPLRLPEFTPAKTVARFPAYLAELLAFDGIAAVSDDSRSALLDYWSWLGIAQPPPVVTIPLGIDLPAPVKARPARSAGTRPIVLCLGSIEGRKNHAVLLAACERLWRAGCDFELHVIGLARPETAAAALGQIRALQAQGRPLRYDGAASDAAVAAAYAACAFTVYPSLMEGFGLPVLESIAHGKPCICSGQGALGEAARGGGCLTVDPQPEPLATAIERLLTDHALYARLADEARGRHFRSWTDYARDLTAFVGTLCSPTSSSR